MNLTIAFYIWAGSTLVGIGAAWANLSVRLKVIEDILKTQDFVTRREFDELKTTLREKDII